MDWALARGAPNTRRARAHRLVRGAEQRREVGRERREVAREERERGRAAAAAAAARAVHVATDAADAVRVLRERRREIVVDHVARAPHVHAARDNVGGDECIELAWTGERSENGASVARVSKGRGSP